MVIFHCYVSSPEANYGKSPFWMGQIHYFYSYGFNSYVSHYQRVISWNFPLASSHRSWTRFLRRFIDPWSKGKTAPWHRNVIGPYFWVNCMYRPHQPKWICTLDLLEVSDKIGGRTKVVGSTWDVQIGAKTFTTDRGRPRPISIADSRWSSDTRGRQSSASASTNGRSRTKRDSGHWVLSV